MEVVSSLPLLPAIILSSSSHSLPFSHGLYLSPIPRHFCAAVGAAVRTLHRGVIEKPRAMRGGRTLSEGWDLSASVACSAWMPRFDELDTTNMLLRQRIVFLGSQVDTMTADLIISQLLFLDAEDQKNDIRLFINSPGGSITAGMGIYDAMKLCKADVSTVCMGLAASMGAFLLAAGTKGKRFCMPNSRVMIHQPHGTAGGRVTEFGLQVREMMYHKLKMNKTFSRITGRPEEQIEIDTRKDYFMSAWEAKEYGLVDAVIDDGKPGLVAPIVEATPPPKTRVWYLWRTDGGDKEMPSELRLSQIDDQNSSENEEKGREKEETQAQL